MFGGTLRMRAPLLFAAGAISVASVGLASPGDDPSRFPGAISIYNNPALNEYAGTAPNATIVPLHVNPVPLPDLVVSSVTSDAHVLVGQQFSVTWTVTNVGAGAVPDLQSTWQDYIYLSLDQFLDVRSDPFLGSVQHVGALQPNGSYTVTRTYTVPHGLTGPYYMFVLTDPIASHSGTRGAVVESNESNNSAATATPMLIDLPPPSDLQIDSVSIPLNASVGDAVTITYTESNHGNQPAIGYWTDAVYLSTTSTWDYGAILLGTVGPPQGGRTLQPGDSYTGTLTATLPPVLPGSYRIIVRADVYNDIYEGANENNNDRASTDALTVSVPTLTVGVPVTTTLPAGGVLLYRVQVPDGKTLQVSLDAAGGANELYLGHEYVPNSIANDAAYAGALQPSQVAVVPTTVAGYYYILVRSESGGGGKMTLTASFLPFGISGVTPDTVGAGQYVTMTVTGARFAPQATVKLIRPDFGEAVPVNYSVVNATKIIAVFDLTGAPVGLYDLQVTNPDGTSQTIPYRVLLQNPTPIDADIGLGGPDNIALSKAGFPNAYYGVSLQSLTNVDTPYLFIQFGVPRLANDTIIPGERLLFQTDLGGSPNVAGVPWADLDSVLNLNGELTASGFAFDFNAKGYGSLSFGVQVYPGLQAVLAKDPTFLADMDENTLASLVFNFHIFAAVTPMTSAEYVAYQTQRADDLRSKILTDSAAPQELVSAAADKSSFENFYLQSLIQAGVLRPQDTPPAARTTAVFDSNLAVMTAGLLGGADGAQLVAGGNLSTFFELVRKWANDTPNGYGSSALPVASQYDLGLSAPTRFEAFTVQVTVPNDFFAVLGDYNPGGVSNGSSSALSQDSALKALLNGPAGTSTSFTITGPTGYRSTNFVPGGDIALPYLINFADPVSGQPVREIKIVEQLDPDFYANSFQLGPVQLEGYTVPIPQGVGAFSGEFDLTSTRGYVLQVVAGVDITTGIATWDFRAIDSDTGNLTDLPNVGLLRPGETAQVSYAIRADSAATSGTALSAQARVFIDQAAPVLTNVVTATLDAAAPTTTLTVQAGANNTYLLTWSAVDDALGSGVREYTVYVSLDGHNYTPLALHSTATTFTYLAATGATPQFLVLSADNAGNLEAPPTGISIGLYAPVINLGALPLVVPSNLEPLPVAPPPTTPPVNTLFVGAQAGIPATLPTAKLPSFLQVMSPFTGASFARGIDSSGAGIGVVGVAIAPDGTVFATGGAGRNEIFTFTAGGTTAAVPLATLDTPVYAMTFDRDGQLWATTGGGALVQLDPKTGAVIASYGVGVTLGLAADPSSSKIYVATGTGIEVFDTTTLIFSPFSRTRVAGLAIAPDGTLWGIEWPGDNGASRRLVTFDRRGRGTVVLDLGTNALDLAFGVAGSALDGLLFVSTVSGSVEVVDTASLQSTVVARGAAGGSFLTTSADGRVYIGTSAGVDVLFPARPPSVIATDPEDHGGVTGNISRATITFDASMFLGLLTDARSVTDPANYEITDMATGLPVTISAALYNPATRQVQLVFDTLAPSSYELRVLPNVQDDFGTPLAAAYSAEFSVVQDETAQLAPGLQFANTRIDRAAGTLSFDVQLTNPLTTTLAGPVRVVLDGIFNQGLAVTNATGIGADGVAFVDLLPSSGSLAAGASTLWVTITVADPQGITPDTPTRVQVGISQNTRPAFVSTPDTAAQAGQAYVYRAAATSPDGSDLSYLLVNGPKNALLNPVTGLLTWTAPLGGTGVISFEVRAIDGSGGYARQTWTVGVSGLIQPPVLVTVPNLTVTAGQTLQVTFSAVDPQGLPITYWLDNLPAGATFDAPSRTLTWIPAGTQPGIYPGVLITASDGENDTTQSFTITVKPGSLPPVFQVPVDRTVTEGGVLAFTVHASDPTGGTVTYSSPSLPVGATLVPATGLFLWTPDYWQHGVYNVEVDASNGTSTASQTFNITVLNVNGPIQFVPLDSLVVNEGQQLSVRVLAVDPNVPGATTNVALTGTSEIGSGGTPTVTYNLVGMPAGATYDPTTNLLTWTPGFTQSGDYAITFSAANDGDGTGTPTTATMTVHIHVNKEYASPVVTPVANQTVAAGATLDFSAQAVDPDGSPLTLMVDGLPGFATLTYTPDGKGTIHVAPVPGDRGNYTLTLNATPNIAGASAALTTSTTFILSVTSPNEPPVLAVVGDKVAVIGQPLVFSVRATDPDQDPLTFAADGLPADATFVGTSVYGVAQFSWTPTASDAGTTTITLRVTDSGNYGAAAPASDSQTVHVVVRATDTAPQLVAIGDQTIAQNSPLAFTLIGSDAENDPLTYTASGLPRGATLDARTGLFSWTPDFGELGTYSVTLGVTDGYLSASQVVNITVTKTDRPPIMITPPPVLGQEGLKLSFQVVAGDLDGNPLSCFVQNLPAGAIFNASTQTFTWTPNYDQAGVYQVTFVAQDPSGAQGSAVAFIQILNVNRPPVFPTPEAHQIVAGTTFTTQLSATDPDGDSLTFSAVNLPAGATFDPNSRTFTWTPVGAQVGRYDIPVTVTDGLASVTQLLTLVVNAPAVPPAVLIQTTPSFPAVPGQAVVVEASASSIGPITSLAITIDGVAQTLDQFNRVTFRPTAPGTYLVVATATDADGNIGTTQTELLVRNPADHTAPAITLDNVANATVVTAPIQVVGSVADINLNSWQLTLTPVGGGVTTVIGSSRAVAAAGTVLGTVDPGDFENGAYTLTLTASNIGGLTSSVQRTIEINTAAKPGAYTRLETDFTITLDGIAIPISRRYSSLDAQQNGAFGYGWQFVLADPNITTNVAPTGQEADGFYAAFTTSTRVYITLPDGTRAGFTFSPIIIESGAHNYFRPAWTPDPGVNFTLSSGPATLEQVGNAFFQVGTGLPYNPTSGRFGSFDYEAMATDGTQYYYTVTNGLREIDGTAGQRLVWTNSGITASDGEVVSIERGTNGYIDRIVAPNGSQAVYQYDTSGNLLQATILEAGRRSWLGYETNSDHLLVNVASTQPEAIRYDANGLFLGVDAIGAVLGTTRQFLGQTEDVGTSDLIATPGADGVVYRSDIVIGANELATSQTGKVTLEVEVDGSGWQPAAASVNGLQVGFSQTTGDTSYALFTFDAPGPYVIEFAPAPGAKAAAFSYKVTLAGDINGDGIVDGADQALLNAALGTHTGDAGFLAAADWNHDGVINAKDGVYIDASFGFTANRAPVATAGAVTTPQGQPISIDLSQFASDPDGNPLAFLLGGATNGDVRLINGGRTAIFTPAGGFSGTATFTLQADDGSLRSGAATITVHVTALSGLHFRIGGANPLLQVGQTQQLTLYGDYDGGSIAFSSGTFTVSSSDSNIVTVGPDGTVLGVGAGTAIVEFHLGNGGVVASAVRVGTADARVLQFYPDTYAMQPGDTRQMVVRERLENSVEDRSGSASGTDYFVSDPAVATISSDGLLVALKSGTITVTTVNGGQSVQATFTITAAAASGATVGTDGGVVQGDGIVVGIPDGALDGNTPIIVRAATQSELPFALPSGWDFTEAIKVDFGSTSLNGGVSLDLAAPAGAQPGDVFYIFEPGTVTIGNGQPDEQSWLLMDKLVAGSDGRMRTTSPPNVGVFNRPSDFNLLFNPTNPGLAAISSTSVLGAVAGLDLFSLHLQSTQSLTYQRTVLPIVSAQGAFGDGTADGPKYYAISSPLGDALVPVPL